MEEYLGKFEGVVESVFESSLLQFPVRLHLNFALSSVL
jgi:hypothetical protein